MFCSALDLLTAASVCSWDRNSRALCDGAGWDRSSCSCMTAAVLKVIHVLVFFQTRLNFRVLYLFKILNVFYNHFEK